MIAPSPHTSHSATLGADDIDTPVPVWVETRPASRTMSTSRSRSSASRSHRSAVVSRSNGAHRRGAGRHCRGRRWPPRMPRRRPRRGSTAPGRRAALRADVVERAGHVGLQVGVAVGVAIHERAELDALGLLRPRAEHGPGFEVHPLVTAGEREEVVPVEDDVDAHVLQAEHGVADGGVAGVLGLHLDAEPHGGGEGHASSLGIAPAHEPWLSHWRGAVRDPSTDASFLPVASAA